MRVKTFVLILAMALLGGLAFELLAFRPGTGAGVPRLVIDTPFMDFGEIPPEKTTRTVAVRNIGTGELKVEKVTTSCNCTTAELTSQAIPPGGSAELKITFDPEFHETEGKVMRLVWIDSNDPATPHAEVEFQVKVVR